MLSTAMRQEVFSDACMCVACRVYRRLESIPTSHDEEEEKVAAELAELLGPERMPWLQLVHQLIVSEEAMQAEQ